MNNSSIWIVIPAFNEATTIRGVIVSLLPQYPNVVVVDDGSSDNTRQEAEEAGAKVVRHCINLGQGASLQTGIEFALRQGASYIVTFDADGQHNPDNIAGMIDVLVSEKLDIVLGSRFLGKTIDMPALRRMVLKAATIFTNLTTGLKLTDTHNGLRAMTAQAASRFDIQQNRMAHASEILNEIADLGLKYKEVPVDIIYTEYSMEKGQKMTDSFRILADLLLGWLAK